MYGCGWGSQLSWVNVIYHERDPHLIDYLFIESHAMKPELDSLGHTKIRYGMSKTKT